MITRRQLFQGLGIAAAGSVGFGGYALAEPWGTTVTRYRLSPPRWPAGLSLRLAVIADIHACEPWMGIDRLRGIVAHANALEPDGVLLLGDYVAGVRMSQYSRAIPHHEWAAALAGLKAPLGTHAVLGNHDWWDDAAAQQRRCGPTRAGLALAAAGIPVYENAGVRLEKDGFGFWLAGLGDQWAFWKPGKRRRGRAYDGVHDLAAALSGAAAQEPVILMAHEPDIFPDVPDRVALTVSGHTHGGQIRFLGYAPVVPSRYGARYVYGHIVEKGRHLIVSGGLGCSGIPVRFGAPPEIVLIELASEHRLVERCRTLRV